MNIEYKQKGLKELCENGFTKEKSLRKFVQDGEFLRALIKKIGLIHRAETFNDLYKISPLHYERLKDNLSGKTSFRILNSRKIRMICEENEQTITLELQEIDDTHYGQD